ncbi:MAG: B12-binding domain-containing radical SAM protein [Candidatus Palauibacterales bacterium]|nr:B12-binding domain-containing radical SAM protein [Candidatus Palauibacterales bacterium]MDP2529117.1 B12-binding domain-containing radical SAM protein [Candidatus Palauibacterales bacterium]MDP2583936.1 B12-binding domain-containing radical SAM protein [Candidatus Palauibacterales bacterium]
MQRRARPVNALLLYPPFPDTFWSFKHALAFTDRDALLPPLGLLTVAALLPDSWSLRLVDLNVEPLTDRELAWADLALVGGMQVQEDSARRLIERCKGAGLPVVAGGPLFAYDHERFEQVDHFVLGEAEVSLPPFLDDLAAGRARRLYRPSALPELAASPIPRWDLVTPGRYASMAVQYSRGCPYGCEFCNVTALFGRRPRIKPAARLLAELDRLYGLGWRGPVFFSDDNLIGNRRHVKEDLLPALIEWKRGKRGMPFFTQASVNLADDAELLGQMREAGFTTVFLGIETPEEAALLEVNKKHNLGRDLAGDVRTIHRAGLQVQAGFIVGFDSDTPSVFERQRSFIQRTGIVTAMVGMLQAPPGTRLRDRLEREGRLTGGITGDNVDGTTNILPRMGLEALRSGYRALVDDLYSPATFYERVRSFLQVYDPPAVRTPLTLESLKGFVRSLYVLGVRERGRRQFWRLAGWVLTHRPRLFPLAVKESICGLHFRRVSRCRIA